MKFRLLGGDMLRVVEPGNCAGSYNSLGVLGNRAAAAGDTHGGCP
jgi:hypothetical protein